MKLFVVIGLGQFGRHTAMTLYQGGAEVIAVDKDNARVELIKDSVGQAICADSTDIDALRSVGIGKADTAIVALGEDDLEDSIVTCTALNDLGLGRIIVRSASEQHGRILTRVGASKIVYPEKQMGEQLAKSLLASGVLEQVTLSTGQMVANIKPTLELIGKTIKEAKLQDKYRLAVIGIQHPRRSIDDRGEVHEDLSLLPVPDPDTVIGDDDILVVVGSASQIELIARED